MVTKTETKHAGEFILSEANGQRSRENGTVVSGQDLVAGTVVELDANGKLTIFEGTTDSGAGADPNPVGVIIEAADATNGDVETSYLARDAEVNKRLVTYNGSEAEMIAGLATIGIIAR